MKEREKKKIFFLYLFENVQSMVLRIPQLGNFNCFLAHDFFSMKITFFKKDKKKKSNLHTMTVLGNTKLAG